MEKLRKIQAELKVPKNQYNAFGKYKYRNAEDILEAVKPLLLKYDLTMIISDDIIEIGGRVYVKANVTVFDEKDKVETFGFAREPENKKGMDDSQLTGSTSSYARKYGLNGMFCIDDTKDADSMDSTTKPLKTSTPQKKELKPGTNAWKNTITKLNDGTVTLETVKKHYIISKENEQKLKV